MFCSSVKTILHIGKIMVDMSHAVSNYRQFASSVLVNSSKWNYNNIDVVKVSSAKKFKARPELGTPSNPAILPALPRS